MTDAEQIEAWIKEFIEKMVQDKFLDLDDLGFQILSGGEIMFHNDNADLMWDGFIMAKRSQPVIELPEIRQHDNINYMYGVSDCKAAITAAGYKYKVKE